MFTNVIMDKEIYFSIKEAAKILGVSTLTLRNWDKSGKFPTSRHPMNNYRIYKRSALERLIADIESGTNKTNAKKVMRKLTIKHLEE